MSRGILVLAIVLVLLLVVAAGAAAAGAVVRRRRQARRPRPTPQAPRHPLVLVHGLAGFDEIGLLGRRHHYFRGVSRRLEDLGAVVYRPRLPPLASVPERAACLLAFLRALPAGRVNVIAHSLGGLDARWAIAKLGGADRIAALVTVGTPHRGTPLGALAELPPALALRKIARRLGLTADALDFLTAARMTAFNAEVADDPRVLYASVVCRAGRGLWLRNPLLAPLELWLKLQAGANDGLVPSASQRWGHTFAELELDHMGQIGWSPGHEASGLYETVARELARRGL